MADDAGGADFEVQLPGGGTVVGTAQDAEHAEQLIEAIRDEGKGHPCVTCLGVVEWDQRKRRWFHKYTGAVTCYPDKAEPTAFPAPPTSHDRPVRRGVWANGSKLRAVN